MPWFRLDDNFGDHAKIVAAGNEAVGLYVRCGAYCAKHLTDGNIPQHVALLYGSAALAETLVRTKLWRRVRGGYKMPDYLDYNPSKQEVVDKSKVRAEAGRKGGVASGKTRSKTEANASGLLEAKRTPSRSHPGVVVDVANQSSDRNGRANPAVIDAIIKEIHDTTGKLIEPDWANRIAALLLTSEVSNPAAYVRQCIRNEHDPAGRFLPHPGPAYAPGRHERTPP